jgi:hypothetical protein
MTTARGRELQGEMRGANNFILLFVCNHFVQGNTRVEITRYPEQYFSIVLLVLSKLAFGSFGRVLLASSPYLPRPGKFRGIDFASSCVIYSRDSAACGYDIHIPKFFLPTPVKTRKENKVKS